MIQNKESADRIIKYTCIERHMLVIKNKTAVLKLPSESAPLKTEKQSYLFTENDRDIVGDFSRDFGLILIKIRDRRGRALTVVDGAVTQEILAGGLARGFPLIKDRRHKYHGNPGSMLSRS